MQEAYETPFDGYDTLFDGDVETRAWTVSTPGWRRWMPP
jgi:hypothetical protein